jgi:hypothetical protein
MGDDYVSMLSRLGWYRGQIRSSRARQVVFLKNSRWFFRGTRIGDGDIGRGDIEDAMAVLRPGEFLILTNEHRSGYEQSGIPFFIVGQGQIIYNSDFYPGRALTNQMSFDKVRAMSTSEMMCMLPALASAPA